MGNTKGLSKMVSSTNYNVAINPNMSSGMGVSNAMKIMHQAPKKETIEVVKDAKIKFRKIKTSDKYQVSGDWSDDYVEIVVTNVTNSPEKLSELQNRYKLITFKATSYKSVYLKNCYKLDYIESPQRYKGAGTKALKILVERSLADKDTQGRVVLFAEIVDGKTSPAGFFYKLGFRFTDDKMNEILANWAKEKILLNAPKLTGMMYLPKENINKLLRYNENLL
jgi:hypothetical protein